MDPCALLTPGEAAASAELTIPMHQRQNWTTSGFDVVPEEIPSGQIRMCEFTWTSRQGGPELPAARGVFNLEVMDAALLPSRGTRRPIPGVADEAFLHANSAYARVGDLALGVTNLGQANRDTGEEPDAPMIGVLGAASGRLR